MTRIYILGFIIFTGTYFFAYFKAKQDIYEESEHQAYVLGITSYTLSNQRYYAKQGR